MIAVPPHPAHEAPLRTAKYKCRWIPIELTSNRMSDDRQGSSQDWEKSSDSLLSLPDRIEACKWKYKFKSAFVKELPSADFWWETL